MLLHQILCYKSLTEINYQRSCYTVSCFIVLYLSTKVLTLHNDKERDGGREGVREEEIGRAGGRDRLLNTVRLL